MRKNIVLRALISTYLLIVGFEISDLMGQNPQLMVQSNDFRNTAVIRISDNNKYLASINHDENFIWVWDIKSGKLLRTFEDKQVKSIYFSSDSKKIISSDAIKTYTIWNIASKEKKVFKINEIYDFITFAGKNDEFVITDNYNKLKLRDAKTGKVLRKEIKISTSTKIKEKTNKLFESNEGALVGVDEMQKPIPIVDNSKYSYELKAIKNTKDFSKGLKKIIAKRIDENFKYNKRLRSEWDDATSVSTAEQDLGILGNIELTKEFDFYFYNNELIVGGKSTHAVKTVKFELSELIVKKNELTAGLKNEIVIKEIKSKKVIQRIKSNATNLDVFELSPKQTYYAVSGQEKKEENREIINTSFAYVWDLKKGNLLGDISSSIKLKSWESRLNFISLINFNNDSTISLNGKNYLLPTLDVLSNSADFKSNDVIIPDIGEDWTLDYFNKPKYCITKNGKRKIAFFIGEGYNEQKFIMWDNSSGEIVQEAEIYSSSNISRYLVSFDERWLILLGNNDDWFGDNKLLIYDLKNKKFTNVDGFKKEISVTDFAFLNKDELLLCTPDGSANIFNISKRKFTKSLGITGVFKKIQALDEDSTYIGLRNDGLVQKIRITQNEFIPELTFYQLGSKDWLTVTNDHYYYGSRKALDAVHYVKGLNIFPFEQFDLKYNRPDIVLRRLKSKDSVLIEAYHKAYLKRLDKMGFKESELGSDFHLPKSEIKNFEYLPLITDSSAIELELGFYDSKYFLNRINVWVNDVAVYGARGKSVKAKHSKNYTQKLTLQLSEGNNKIQVSCLNSKGAESLKQTIELRYHPKEKQKTKLYVVAIGISEYFNPENNLTYADKDAKDFLSLFSEKNEVFDSTILIPILNKKATRKNILAVKKELKKSAVNDQVIIFYAGHGVFGEDGDYYLASSDVENGNISGSALNYRDFEALLDSISARKKILFIDACHSGEPDDVLASNEIDEFSENDNRNIKVKRVGRNIFSNTTKLKQHSSFELMKSLFADLRRGTGATIISSAGAGEYALEGGGIKNGVFTYVLMKGLKDKKADLNKDETITVSELRSYVFERVQKITNGRQNPSARRENLETDFVIWK